ncbi:MAG: CRISPR-associated protein, partial [Chloroflexi bacterium]|nr:CRISPR-associated protein [Chloroflexota bacterium]
TDTFLEEVDDRVILSTWGKLVWQKSRQSLLSEELLDFPHLIPTPDFRQEFKKASKEERIQLQEALAKVAVIFHISGGNTANLKKHAGLLYENYDNKSTSDGLPIGHFRLNKARRVSCVSAGGMLQLRHFGAHDYVNHNP